MFVVDTNILVYSADRGSPMHPVCRERLDAWRRQAAAWYLTWGIVYEFLRVTTHPRVLRHPWTTGESWAFITALLASPGLGLLVPTERHATVAGAVLGEVPHLTGNLLYDAKTAVLMREHGIRTIYTRDTDFHRFPFLDAVDPTG